MPRKRINCQFCSQLMEVNVEDVGRRLRCPGCQQIFEFKEEPKTSATKKEAAVTTIPCGQCGREFGIAADMKGRLVACPFCKAQTKLPETAGPTEPATSAVDSGPKSTERGATSDERTEKRRRRFREPEQKPLDDLPPKATDSPPEKHPDPVADAAADAGHPSDLADTVVPVESEEDESKTESKAEEAPSETDRAPEPMTDDLPPQFVGGDDEDLGDYSADTGTSGVLDINTHVTRIQLSEEVVAVRSLTREEKDRRKKLRVGIVFGLSVLILIVLFVVLS